MLILTSKVKVYPSTAKSSPERNALFTSVWVRFVTSHSAQLFKE